MWVLMMVITCGAHIVNIDRSVEMTAGECRQAVKDARLVTAVPAKADEAVAVVFYCKKVK